MEHTSEHNWYSEIRLWDKHVEKCSCAHLRSMQMYEYWRRDPFGGESYTSHKKSVLGGYCGATRNCSTFQLLYHSPQIPFDVNDTLYCPYRVHEPDEQDLEVLEATPVLATNTFAYITRDRRAHRLKIYMPLERGESSRQNDYLHTHVTRPQKTQLSV